MTGVLDTYVAGFLAVLLIASALHKSLDRRRLAGSVEALIGVGGRLALLVLVLAALVEFAAGAALILPATRLYGAVAAAVIWSLYLRLILRAVGEGRADIDCGCAFGRRSAPLGLFEAGRNLTLVALAAATAAGAAHAPAVGALEALAGLGLFTLYVAIDQISALVPRERWA